MNKVIFLACTLLLYAGCTSNPRTGRSGNVGLSSEIRLENQRAREGGLSEQWVLKEDSGMAAKRAEVPMVESPAAGTTGAVVVTGTGQVELSDQAEIELRKEELVVEKRPVSNGSVVIRKVVQTESVSKPIELKREEYVIERVPATATSQGIGPGIVNAFQAREIYLPLMREEAVVGKQAVLTETVTIGKRIETDLQTVSHPVRSEDVEIVKNPNLADGRFAQLPHGTLPAAELPVVRGNAMPVPVPDTVHLTKEELLVGKKAVENGGVYIQKVVRTQEASMPVETRREEFTIQRTPANQPVASADFVQKEYQVELTREQPVVGVRNYATEIVRLHKQVQTDTQMVQGTIRKESLEIVKNTLERPISAAAPVGTPGTLVQSGSGISSEMFPVSSGHDLLTITGKAVCAKCQLKETASCQNAIQVKSGGRTIVYHLVDNAMTKNFHQEMIGKTVTATGTVQEAGGTMEMVATQLSLAK